MNLLITGGLGFIGSNLIRLVRRVYPSWRVVNLDLVTYAANRSNLTDIDEGSHYQFVQGDIANRALVDSLYREERFDAVIHCAAESHVDRSIEDSGRFLQTNVLGTLVLLEAAAELGGVRHVQMGTDEVYGSLAPNDAAFTEATPLAPRSPYSASKAAGDQLALAFHYTYGLQTIVTRCSNNYGPYQHPEKFIPLMITSAIRRLPLPIYGDGRQRRDWIHVEDHCRGVLAALLNGRPGEIYNFGGGSECENLEIVRNIVKRLGVDESLIQHVEDRPGHDRRYSVISEKAERELEWHVLRSLGEGLRETVDWYRMNDKWWMATASTAYAASRDRIAAWGRNRERAHKKGRADQKPSGDAQ